MWLEGWYYTLMNPPLPVKMVVQRLILCSTVRCRVRRYNLQKLCVARIVFNIVKEEGLVALLRERQLVHVSFYQGPSLFVVKTGGVVLATVAASIVQRVARVNHLGGGHKGAGSVVVILLPVESMLRTLTVHSVTIVVNSDNIEGAVEVIEGTLNDNISEVALSFRDCVGQEGFCGKLPPSWKNGGTTLCVGHVSKSTDKVVGCSVVLEDIVEPLVAIQIG